MMDDQAIAGLLAIAAIAAAMIGCMYLLARAVYPVRERMFELSVQIINDKHTSEADRRVLEILMDRALSANEGWRMTAWAWRMVLSNMRGERPTPPRGRIDPRCLQVMQMFFVSVGAANPIAGFFVVSLFAFDVLVVERRKSRAREIVTTSAGNLFRNPSAI